MMMYEQNFHASSKEAKCSCIQNYDVFPYFSNIPKIINTTINDGDNDRLEVPDVGIVQNTNFMPLRNTNSSSGFYSGNDNALASVVIIASLILIWLTVKYCSRMTIFGWRYGYQQSKLKFSKNVKKAIFKFEFKIIDLLVFYNQIPQKYFTFQILCFLLILNFYFLDICMNCGLGNIGIRIMPRSILTLLKKGYKLSSTEFYIFIILN